MKTYELPITKDELAILEVCVNYAESAAVGEKIKERFFKAVDSLKTKLLIARIELDKEREVVYHVRF